MGNLLEVKNLSKEYEGFTLKDISFTLLKGYIVLTALEKQLLLKQL